MLLEACTSKIKSIKATNMDGSYAPSPDVGVL